MGLQTIQHFKEINNEKPITGLQRLTACNGNDEIKGIQHQRPNPRFVFTHTHRTFVHNSYGNLISWCTYPQSIILVCYYIAGKTLVLAEDKSIKGLFARNDHNECDERFHSG